MKYSQVYCLVAVAFLIAVLGCSPSRYIKTEPVEGYVTLDGEPVVGCTLVFFPVREGEGEPSFAVTDNRGFYRVATAGGRIDAGTIPGEYIVVFGLYEHVSTGRQTRDDDGNLVDVTREVSLLHRNYESRERTPWRVTVQEGRNRFDFPLRSDGSGPSQ